MNRFSRVSFVIVAFALRSALCINPYMEYLSVIKYDIPFKQIYQNQQRLPQVQPPDQTLQQTQEVLQFQAPLPVQEKTVKCPVFEPVVFSATRAKESTRKAGSQIHFENVLTDIGYGWDSFSKSQFVCYHPGVYLFTFSALSPVQSTFRIALMHNSKEAMSIYGDRSGHNSASGTVILTLDRGDTVYLTIREGSIFENVMEERAYTTFSGFRMGEVVSK